MAIFENIKFDEIREKAKGRWFGIMQALGIQVGDGGHTGCPICGPGQNKHRFRFSEKEGNGVWICTQCQGGDGFSLVQKVLGCDIKEAFEAVAKVIDVAPSNPITQEKKADPEEFKKLLKASYKVKKGDPVGKYLKERGLSDIPKNIFYCPACYEFETRQDQNAMLAIFRAPDGEALTLHRTFIKDGKKLDVKAPRKTMSVLDGKKMTGGAVRLYDGKPEVLGVCEGIETAIAVHEMYGVVIWHCLNENLLE